MTYKYVTENNLYDKQTYMYSEYKGIAFLKEYLASRYSYLNRGGTQKEEADDGKNTYPNPVKTDLRALYEKLKNREYDGITLDAVNKYVKSFEVRKRIYTEYDINWKPLEGAGFEDYENYLLFADCLLNVYGYGECLKYFSCLLKVDDTLLSVQDKMDAWSGDWLKKIIRQELDFFCRLVNKAGLDWEEIK